MTLILIDLPNNIHLRITKYKVVYDVIDSLGFLYKKKKFLSFEFGEYKIFKRLGEG